MSRLRRSPRGPLSARALRSPRAPIGTLAVIAGVMLLAADALAGARDYIDLRSIQPVHGDAAAGEKKATLCFACHGANGNSIAPMFPRLAGQREGYLYYRLVSFHRADPKDPYYSASPMTANAATLSDTDMRDLAAYFSQQVPQPADSAVADGPAAAPPAAAPANQSGQLLFMNGDPARGIPPCQGCHGADAKGPAISSQQYGAWPALRGQYAPYLTARLSNYHSGQPADTSNTFIMHAVAQTLDDASIQALAQWLGALPPD